jgi:transposase
VPSAQRVIPSGQFRISRIAGVVPPAISRPAACLDKRSRNFNGASFAASTDGISKSPPAVFIRTIGTLRATTANQTRLGSPFGERSNSNTFRSYCPILAVATLAEMQRDMQRLQFVRQQIKAIEQTRFERLKKDPNTRLNMMVLLVARVFGMGIETADMLVHEVLSRDFRDRRAVARDAGLTGSPDESGARRREKGLARAGNARVRRGMIEFAWRFVRFQKDSTLAQWFRARTADARGPTRKTMIVALARKLLIALWRLVTTGEIPTSLTRLSS